MGARHLATGSPPRAEGVARGPRSTLRRRAALALATAALGTLALAAPARADTTIGQATGAGTLHGIFSVCAEQQVVADTNYVVPSGGGTITSFSYNSAPANVGQQLDFLVLRPAGGSNYTVVGKSGLVTLAGSDGSAVETFAANIPVQGGEILGFWPPDDLNTCWFDASPGTGGFISSFPTATADPSVGGALSLPTTSTSRDVNEAANLVTTPTIADLIDTVEALNLHHGIENGLLKKLTKAQRDLDADDLAGTCDELASFISQVKAQSGKKIDADDAADLIDDAQAVEESVGCG